MTRQALRRSMRKRAGKHQRCSTGLSSEAADTDRLRKLMQYGSFKVFSQIPLFVVEFANSRPIGSRSTSSSFVRAEQQLSALIILIIEHLRDKCGAKSPRSNDTRRHNAQKQITSGRRANLRRISKLDDKNQKTLLAQRLRRVWPQVDWRTWALMDWESGAFREAGFVNGGSHFGQRIDWVFW